MTADKWEMKPSGSPFRIHGGKNSLQFTSGSTDAFFVWSTEKWSCQKLICFLFVKIYEMGQFSLGTFYLLLSWQRPITEAHHE